MKAAVRQLVDIEITPTELRKIADEMERRLAETKVGDRVPMIIYDNVESPVVTRFILDYTKHTTHRILDART